MKKIPVVITTDSTKRGVFMGFINPQDIKNEIIEAEEVRMAVFWDRDVRGVTGLAATGPTKTCRISKAVSNATLKGVTAVFEISETALVAWRKEYWKD